MRLSNASLFAGLLSILILPCLAHGQGPTGTDIAQKAAKAQLASANTVSAQKEGKKIKFTPIDFDAIQTVDDLDGKVVGVLETALPGESLPPGKYDLFLAKSGNDWHVYAESGGTIVQDTTHVQISQSAKTQGSKKPKITFGTFHVCLYDGWICIYF